MRKMGLLVLSVVVFCGQSVFGASDYFNYFMMTQMGASASMIGKGNVEGFNNQASAVFENPASLSHINQFSATLFQTKFMDEVTYQSFSAAYRVPYGVLGFGYMSLGVNDIIRTSKVVLDPDASIDNYLSYDIVDVGRFNYANQMLRFAYQYSQTDTFHLGVAGTFFSSSIDTYRGNGFNVDAGLVWDAEPWSFSFSVKNVIPAMKVNYTQDGNPTYNAKENLPLQLVYGAQYQFDDFSILGQLRFSDNNKKFLKSVGVQYAPSFLPLITLSAGFKEFPVIRDVKSNLTLGLGLQVSGVSFDYAYERSDYIENNHKHYFSLGVSF